jgi:hypothetical protein
MTNRSINRTNHHIAAVHGAIGFATRRRFTGTVDAIQPDSKLSNRHIATTTE